jgi:hypothetical protein
MSVEPIDKLIVQSLTRLNLILERMMTAALDGNIASIELLKIEHQLEYQTLESLLTRWKDSQH